MNPITRCVTVAILCMSALSLSGCLVAAVAVGAGAGVAGAVYVKGDLETTVAAEPRKVVAASERAVEGMGFIKVSSVATDIDGQVIARTAGDKRVAINVKKTGENMSSLSIRVGTWGDEAMSRQILERINAEL